MVICYASSARSRKKSDARACETLWSAKIRSVANPAYETGWPSCCRRGIGAHSCRWRWLKGIKKSRHSRRRLPPSRSHTEPSGSHRRSQNPYPQIGKALVNRLREDAVPIMDDDAVGIQGAGAPPCTGSCNVRSATDHLRWLTVRKNSTGSRQILHLNATAHPAAEWTLQQFREALPGGAASSPPLTSPRQSVTLT